jgi:4a-hydroxytetrahydrobiopterin dehydratase
VVGGHHIQKKFSFPDFVTALAFVNRIGAVAEEQQHHPDLLLGWGKVEVTSFTHTVDGLTEKDYALAAAIDQVL